MINSNTMQFHKPNNNNNNTNTNVNESGSDDELPDPAIKPTKHIRKKPQQTH